MPKEVTTHNSPRTPRAAAWTLALVSVALFMVTLDNLVVTTALPSIRTDLGASLESLEWTVNAYTLTYAVLLLIGSALGDRFGRRRMFLAGLSLFTVSSAAAAVAPTTVALIAARATQGAGAAIVTPLTLTLLAEAFPGAKRGLALGVWSGVSGLGVALGPLVGGAVVDGIAWQWIFWLNVPVGAIVIPLALARLQESRGERRPLDLLGLGLGSAGLLGVVYGVVRGNAAGWTSFEILGAMAAGVALLVAFVVHERRAKQPMLPMEFFASRGFSAVNAVSLTMYFGIFGSIFLLAQVFQTVDGYSPFEAGLRTLPWTGVPMFVAPIAGILSDRIGSRPLMALGLALQAGAIAWIASVMSVDVAYSELVPAFIAGGAGMGLVFAPAANAVLAAVKPSQAGQASGATNTIRELGGVLGVSVLAAVFAHNGGYQSPQAFVDGVTPALAVGAVVLALGAVAALAIPGKQVAGTEQAPDAAPIAA